MYFILYKKLWVAWKCHYELDSLFIKAYEDWRMFKQSKLVHCHYNVQGEEKRTFKPNTPTILPQYPNAKHDWLICMKAAQINAGHQKIWQPLWYLPQKNNIYCTRMDAIKLFSINNLTIYSWLLPSFLNCCMERNVGLLRGDMSRS
jgi:hypothetical protein